MSLKGLNKQPPSPAAGQDADAFIGAAKVLHNGAHSKPSGVRYKRVNLSLDEHVDTELDRLSLLPRDFKASRSDVVKAAVALLATHTDTEIIEMLRNLRN
ncbi:hypothetical protein [Pseudomonas juntendi]|uniref:hypothetical protein n=1 Tax=Pseudomonas juntendi TaxID=2666183 RepID=UPI0015F7FBA5|nr:hypothetical protein [Pseudomonas juntendi]MBA6129974.1 hypothetical protein [Pseudomonas juntendi]